MTVAFVATDPAGNTTTKKRKLVVDTRKPTLTLGGTKQLIAQIVGVLAVGAYVVPVSAICWLIIKALVGLRVSPQEEIEGLDIGEHGNEAYHGFVMARSE